jgi:hypothetical protein
VGPAHRLGHHGADERDAGRHRRRPAPRDPGRRVRRGARARDALRARGDLLAGARPSSGAARALGRACDGVTHRHDRGGPRAGGARRRAPGGGGRLGRSSASARSTT